MSLQGNRDAHISLNLLSLCWRDIFQGFERWHKIPILVSFFSPQYPTRRVWSFSYCQKNRVPRASLLLKALYNGMSTNNGFSLTPPLKKRPFEKGDTSFPNISLLQEAIVWKQGYFEIWSWEYQISLQKIAMPKWFSTETMSSRVISKIKELWQSIFMWLKVMPSRPFWAEESILRNLATAASELKEQPQS